MDMTGLEIVLHLLGFPDVTHLLARIWGIVCIAFFTGILCNRNKFVYFLAEADSQYLAIVLSGILALVGGIVSIIFHSAWSANLLILITLLGWISFFYGIFAIIFPQAICWMAKKIARLDSCILTCISLVFICGGALLFYKGLEDTKKHPYKPLPVEISDLESKTAEGE